MRRFKKITPNDVAILFNKAYIRVATFKNTGIYPFYPGRPINVKNWKLSDTYRKKTSIIFTDAPLKVDLEVAKEEKKTNKSPKDKITCSKKKVTRKLSFQMKLGATMSS